MNNKKILFVGAGPIGLWTAIQIKLRDPNISIEMFEKYLVYKRNHILHVSRTSLAFSVNDKDFQEMVNKFVGDIKINEMEQQLYNFAKKIGINIHHQEVMDCDDLELVYPTANYIIGSDGSHSIVRNQKFSDDFDVNFNIKYIVDVKYEIKGKALSLSWLDWTSVITKCNYYIKERSYINKYENKSNIILRIFVDELTYKKITKDGKCSFKNPSYLDDEFKKTVPQLYNTISIWINAKQQYLNEKIINDPKITAVHLDIYKSKKVVERDDFFKTWILVGDSAFGVPFFRALNCGLLSGTILSIKICEELDSPTDEQNTQNIFSLVNKKIKNIKRSLLKRTPLDEYESYVNNLTHYETAMAEIKNNILDSGLASIDLSKNVINSSSSIVSKFKSSS